MPLWIMISTLFVLAAASGVNARSFDTTMAIMARPSGVVLNCKTLTKRDASSNRCASSITSGYSPVSFHSVLSPVVSRSRGASLVLAVNDDAALRRRRLICRARHERVLRKARAARGAYQSSPTNHLLIVAQGMRRERRVL